MGSPSSENLQRNPLTFTELHYDKNEANDKPTLSLKLIAIAIDQTTGKVHPKNDETELEHVHEKVKKYFQYLQEVLEKKIF